MASTRTQHLTLVRPDGRLQPRRPYPPLSRLNGVRKGWRVPGVLTGTRRSDSPAFDELDGGSSYQSKTPGTAFRPAHTPVGSKVWGRPFQRAAGPGRRPGRPSQRAKLLIRSEHFCRRSGVSERNCPEGAALSAERLCSFLFERKKERRSLLALHPAALQIHPSGVFCNLSPPPGTPNCPVCRELFRWFVESPRKVFCRCKEKGLDR